MQVFSYEIWKNFKNTYFEEHLQMTVSGNCYYGTEAQYSARSWSISNTEKIFFEPVSAKL